MILIYHKISICQGLASNFLVGTQRAARRRKSLSINNLREQPTQEHHQAKNDCAAHKIEHNEANP